MMERLLQNTFEKHWFTLVFFYAIELILLLCVLLMLGPTWVDTFAPGATAGEGLFFGLYLFTFALILYSLPLILSYCLGKLIPFKIIKILNLIYATVIVCLLLIHHRLVTVLSLSLFSRYTLENSTHFIQHLDLNHLVIIAILATPLVIIIVNGYLYHRLDKTVAKWIQNRSTHHFNVILPVFFMVLMASAFMTTGRLYHHKVNGDSILLALPGSELFLQNNAYSEHFAKGKINYDSHAYPSTTPRKKPNILFLQIESLRADMLETNYMPNLMHYNQQHQCLTSKFHTPTSHASEEGTFSLLYGLNAYNYLTFRREEPLSFPLMWLKSLGYRLQGVSAPIIQGYRQADFIVKNFDDYKETFRKAKAGIIDKEAISELARQVQSGAKNQPRFNFIFLNSTHYNYTFPDEFLIDKPVLTTNFSIFSNNISQQAPLIKNRYTNSVRYVDSLFGEIIELLKEDIDKDNLIIVVTGDHGEAFWEHGFGGHTETTLSNQLIQVPLVMCLPGVAGAEVPLSSNPDIWPSILEYLGLYPEDQILATKLPLDGTPLASSWPAVKYALASAIGFPEFTSKIAYITPFNKFILNLNTQREESPFVLESSSSLQEPTDDTPVEQIGLKKLSQKLWYHLTKHIKI